MKPWRVVLDTNVLLSALLFSTGRLAWLREAWQGRRLVPVVCRQTAQELLRVLAYPKFKLADAERDELLADLLPYVETFLLPESGAWPELPPCRDGEDQVFLALAKLAKVGALVSGDADLLALQETFSPPILNPEEFRRRFVGRVSEP